MNHGLKNEMAWLTGLSALGLWLAKEKELAKAAAIAALGLRLLPLPKTPIKNSSVVITGGSRGLGLAIAEQFILARAKVSILARDEKELKKAKEFLEQHPGAVVHTLCCDITERNQLSTAFQEVILKFGSIDILINNAGSILVGPFASQDQVDFAKQMQIHFEANLGATQILLPQFRKQGRAHIVNIASIGAKIPVPHLSAYCASKFALAGYSETLAAELYKDGINVTTVYPGLMRTGSTIQAVFKGDHQREHAWFALSDNTPGITVSARYAAYQILKAVKDQKTQLIISLPAKIAHTAFALVPEIFNSTMRLVVALLPKDENKTPHQGSESRAWLEQKVWSKPFLKIDHLAQSEFNQTTH